MHKLHIMRNSTPIIITLLILLVVQAPTPVLGQNTSEIIGQVKSEVVLERIGEKFRIQYQNNNENSASTTNSLTIEDKATLDRLYTFLVDGFESMDVGPVQFKLSGSELRIYFIKRIGKDQIEIIHEDIATEETGTLNRLTKKEIQKLFGKEH